MPAASRVARAVGVFLAVNLPLFAAYHAGFVLGFAPGVPAAEVLAVLGRAVRFDLALLGQELLVLGAVCLLTRHVRHRAMAAALWGLTAAHALVLVTNLLVYRERNQHLWDVLLVNIAAPREVWVALEPFLVAQPLAPLLAAAGAVALAVAARRHLRSVTGRLDLWRSPRTVALAVAGLALLALPSLDLVQTKRPLLPGGYSPKIVKSKRALAFPRYASNQAVGNPVYDLLHEYAPAFASIGEYRLPRAEALATALELLGLSGADERYPLLRTVRGREGLGLENVVLVQVEGLGASILEHRVQGAPVMPFLAGLAAEGLALTEIYQSFNHTERAVYATVTGLPAELGLRTDLERFTDREVRGHCASLARILGSDGYRHYAFAGFRQRIDEFERFMSNQGYEALGFEAFVARLGPGATGDVNRLGVFDGPLLQESARILLATEGRFTAHVMTATSHSPWIVPPQAPRPFGVAALDAFRYVDESLRAFVERLREHPGFARTLFVVVGDHTSATVADGLRERLRVPLVFWAADLAAHRARWRGREAARGSQVDILPTILGFLGGAHRYAGIGDDLLEDRVRRRGAISGGHPTSYYLVDGFALEYRAQQGAARLLPFEGAEIALRDVGSEHPDLLRRLIREFLALQETAERLARENRVYPEVSAPR
jgi:hypothetical protein